MIRKKKLLHDLLRGLTAFLLLHSSKYNRNNHFLYSTASRDRKSVWSVMRAVNICYACIRDHFIHVSSCNMEKLECRDSFCMFIHTHTFTESRHNMRSPSVFILPKWRSNIPSQHHNFPSTTVKHYWVSLVYGPWIQGCFERAGCWGLLQKKQVYWFIWKLLTIKPSNLEHVQGRFFFFF